MQKVDDSEMYLILILMLFVALMFYSMVSSYHRDNRLEKVMEYSSDDWSVTFVDFKESYLDADGIKIFMINLATHHKAPVREIEVNESTYKSLHKNQMVKYRAGNAQDTFEVYRP